MLCLPFTRLPSWSEIGPWLSHMEVFICLGEARNRGGWTREHFKPLKRLLEELRVWRGFSKVPFLLQL